MALREAAEVRKHESKLRQEMHKRGEGPSMYEERMKKPEFVDQTVRREKAKAGVKEQGRGSAPHSGRILA